MRILIFGGNGMLGHKLVQVLGAEHEVWATIRGQFSNVQRFGFFDEGRTVENTDVEDLSQVRAAIETVEPDVVINAAGIIKQLASNQNVIHTLMVNSIFPHRLACLSNEFGFRLITISTDCVFDGQKGNYSEDDVSNAVDLYGRSKNLGEIQNGNALTIRTSIIGRELAGGHSIVEWFLSHRGGTVKGFTGAIYSGFPSVILSSTISELIKDHPALTGLYHVSSEPISKYDLLRLIDKYYGSNIEIVPSSEVVIDRSLESIRFREATGFIPLDWDEMIRQMSADQTNYDEFHAS